MNPHQFREAVRLQKEYATIETVTPELAKEMLTLNKDNRCIRGWYVDMLASAMKRGEWVLTSSGFGITMNSRLSNGQHTAMAIIASGCSIRRLIVFGLSEVSFEHEDTGITRTLADLMRLDRRVAEPVRFAASIALSTRKLTTNLIWPFFNCGLGSALDTLIHFCGTKQRYFSSAPLKLAACIKIMDGESADFVMSQYRAMVLLDYEAMTAASMSLARQVQSLKVHSTTHDDSLARGLKVFERARAGISKIQISDADVAAARAYVRDVLNNAVSDTLAKEATA